MEYTTLGRTGLKVSVAGLGSGGGSRLGLGQGKSRQNAIDIVRGAIDLGVTLIDTAKGYGTEDVVGEALQGVKRDSIVVSTKHLVWREEGLYSAEQVVAGLDDSLRLLRMDYVDIFMLHALTLKRGKDAQYEHAAREIVPALLREKEKGKFRFLGATGAPNPDPRHEGIARGVDDDLFDVVMIAFSLFNQNARKLVFPKTIAHNVGTMLMFVVRSIFADDQQLRSTIQLLARNGKIPSDLADKSDPLDFLIHDGSARNHLDAAYRYARHEPGAHVVLFGTGDAKHMESNIASITSPALPEADRAKVRELFGQLVSVGLDIPAGRGQASAAVRRAKTNPPT